MLLTSFLPTDLLRGIYEVFFHVAFLSFHLLSLIVDACIFIGVSYRTQERPYQVSEKQLLSNTQHCPQQMYSWDFP